MGRGGTVLAEHIFFMRDFMKREDCEIKMGKAKGSVEMMQSFKNEQSFKECSGELRLCRG